MERRIEVFTKKDFPDTLGNEIKSEIENIGITSVDEIRIAQVYLIDGDLSTEDVKCICNELLTDGLTQDCIYVENHPFSPPSQGGDKGEVIKSNRIPLDSEQLQLSGKTRFEQKRHKDNVVYTIEVARKQGVMDPVESTVIKGIRDLGLDAKSVKTTRRFLITGVLTLDQAETIANKVLANKIIEDVFINKHNLFYEKKEAIDYVFRKNILEILNAEDEQLRSISEKGQLYLNLQEMKAVQEYFTTLSRNPTDVELETIAQTWSEHCMHKTFKGVIEYNGECIDNLLANTIMKVTSELNKPWCVSVFKDNAGIIEFDEDYDICFKVETHNHPSAIEPYGGANTGIGGVIRDTLGTGLGAKPILNTDVFCFGPLDLPEEKVPEGALHPKRIFKGVVAGVRDYGNRMGIPTANGAIFFDER
ncbi:MAG: phosphoribosylformylglycinamidine synthase subunit PurS, partial [Candidatus Scalindua sediminis]